MATDSRGSGVDGADGFLATNLGTRHAATTPAFDCDWWPVLLAEGKPQTLVAPNAGYNFGLVGVAQDLAVKAGQSLRLPLLISIDRTDGGPDLNLSAALETLREQPFKGDG